MRCVDESICKRSDRYGHCSKCDKPILVEELYECQHCRCVISLGKECINCYGDEI